MKIESVLAPRLIRASAGTGKTRDLSSRYIGLLALGEAPERILATTFTRKAAGEIRERVFSRLAEAARHQTVASELGESFARAHFTSKDALDLLIGMTEQQHRLQITTLDALFISITRSFALELGLPADWRVASVRDQELLREEAIRLLFEEHQRSVAIEMVRSLHGGTLARSVHAQIVKDVMNLFQLYLFSDRSAWDWIEIPETPSAEENRAFLNRLDAIRAPLTKKGEPDKVWQRAIVALCESVNKRNWVAFSEIGLVGAVLAGVTQFNRHDIPAELREIVLWAGTEVRRESLIRMQLQLHALYDMLGLYQRCYAEAQRRLGILSFDDIKYQLASYSLRGELDHIYYRLDARIAHLLLDEFQDTSITEWRVLEPIADEILSQSEQHSFFCVGDMKQAIYGWRGGVAEIFGTIERRWPQLQAESKQTTYRCSPAVIECVNLLFLSLGNLACLDKHRESVDSWSSRFEEHSSAKKDLQGCVELRVVPEAGPSVFQVSVALIADLAERYPRASIGVLVRKNSAVSELLGQFSRLEKKIEVSEEGGTSLTDSALVRLLLSLLRFLDHPSDSLARFHIDWCGISDLLGIPLDNNPDQLLEWQMKIRLALLKEGYGAVIGGWSRVIAPHCRKRDQVRLDQLVDLAYRYDSARSLCADDFVAYVVREKVELPSEALVRVMTFHKAKGLEFDIVVLPDLTNEISMRAGSVLTDRPSPVDAPRRIAPSSNAFERSLIPELQEMYRNSERALISEALSVLYVALTRARQGLYMIVPEQLRPGRLSMARIIKDTFPIEENPALIAGSSDWEFSGDLDTDRGRALINIPEGSALFKQESVARRGVLTRINPSQNSDSLRLRSREHGELAGASRFRGIALHKLLEQIEWIETFDANAPDYHRLLREAGIPADSIGDLVYEFRSLIKQEKFCRHFSRARFDAENSVVIYREQSFALRRVEQLIVGTFDRLVIEKKGTQVVSAELIDFKSDRSKGATRSAAERAEKYRQQLDHYCFAAQRFAGVPVSGKVLFIEDGEIVQLI